LVATFLGANGICLNYLHVNNSVYIFETGINEYAIRAGIAFAIDMLYTQYTCLTTG
jgi:hypothetical protein